MSQLTALAGTPRSKMDWIELVAAARVLDGRMMLMRLVLMHYNLSKHNAVKLLHGYLEVALLVG